MAELHKTAVKLSLQDKSVFTGARYRKHQGTRHTVCHIFYCQDQRKITITLHNIIQPATSIPANGLNRTGTARRWFLLHAVVNAKISVENLKSYFDVGLRITFSYTVHDIYFGDG